MQKEDTVQWTLAEIEEERAPLCGDWYTLMCMHALAIPYYSQEFIHKPTLYVLLLQYIHYMTVVHGMTVKLEGCWRECSSSCRIVVSSSSHAVIPRHGLANMVCHLGWFHIASPFCNAENFTTQTTKKTWTLDVLLDTNRHARCVENNLRVL